jgi:Zn-finger nucleic acid-binding protein
MSSCPFCSAPMQLLKDGSAGQSCRTCHAAWLEAGKLVNVVGRPALERLVENAASDGTQRCSACHKPYRDDGCPRCGGTPVTCPGCGGTLSTFTLLEISVDVCPPCQGVLFDPGELRELRTRMARVPAPATEREVLSHFECESCGKRVQWRHGFEWDSKYHCGSCAPRGSASLDETLTRHPSGLVASEDTAPGDSGFGTALLGLAAYVSALVFD